MLEIKSFGEVNLDSTPIVVLGCGHFFTTETLDGHVGMAEVYAVDSNGDFVGLQDVSQKLAPALPRCPDCQRPIRQYATQRYNRLINRAVIDEMSKRFLASGKANLQALETQVSDLETDFDNSRRGLLGLLNAARSRISPVQSVGISEQLMSRNSKSDKLTKVVASFLESVGEKHQPVRKLHDASVGAVRARRPLDELMERLVIDGVSTLSPDRQIILEARAVQLKVKTLILADRLELLLELESKMETLPSLDPWGKAQNNSLPHSSNLARSI